MNHEVHEDHEASREQACQRENPLSRSGASSGIIADGNLWEKSDMRRVKSLAVGAALAAGVAWLVTVQLPVAAAENTGVISGVVSSPKGPEAGRVGDCRNRGHAHQVSEDRRDRRSRALSAAGAAEDRVLQSMGTRLRPGGFEAGDGQAGSDAEPDCRDREDTAGSRPGTIRPATGRRCWKCRRRASSRGRDRPATGSIPI